MNSIILIEQNKGEIFAITRLDRQFFDDPYQT
jgi:hypothetical protein